MNKAIVIGSYHARHDWLRDCLASLQGVVEYPIIPMLIPWELNTIKYVYEHTDIDEFLFLQDTVVVKDQQWVHETMEQTGSVSLSNIKPFFMYLGKYTRYDLKTSLIGREWPEVRTKRQAVTHEGEWTSWYDKWSMNPQYLWPLDDTDVYETRHGRINKVIENDHIIKYKGTWSPEMIE